MFSIVGARPQFIKSAAVSRAIRGWNEQHPDRLIREKLIHTGQHYDANMSEVFFEQLHIPNPAINLSIGSGSHGKQTGRMLMEIESCLLKELPDAVLVYGDTNTTLAGAMAAAKLNVPITHVEAGLRSFNKQMPEEQNRIVTDHLSTILFCPTRTAMSNLYREGFPEFKAGETSSSDQPAVVHCGDVMYDCVRYYSKIADERKELLTSLELIENKNQVKPFILATIHRPENTDSPERIRGILSALAEISCQLMVVLPLHPRTQKIISNDYDLKDLSKSFKLIDPISYLDMILLESKSQLICTDSGGVQKEAFFLNKPCITMRDQTEWVETSELGWNLVTGANKGKILEACLSVIDWLESGNRQSPFPEMKMDLVHPFGKGKAAEEIVSHLVQLLY